MKSKALILWGLLFATSLSAVELTVHAAASLKEALTEIGAGYEKESGDKVVFNFGASSTLARQIEQGAPADLFFSADEAKVDALEKKGCCSRARAGACSPTRSSLSSLRTLRRCRSPRPTSRSRNQETRARRATTVPAGIYAREYLEKLGLWDAVKDKVVPTENVRGCAGRRRIGQRRGRHRLQDGRAHLEESEGRRGNSRRGRPEDFLSARGGERREGTREREEICGAISPARRRARCSRNSASSL